MLRQYLYLSESLTYLKRKIYILLLPAFILAFGTVLALLFVYDGKVDLLNIITFSLLIGGLGLAWLVLFLKKDQFWLAEWLVFLVATLLFLMRMIIAIMDDLGLQGDDHLGTVSYWTPIYYFFVFLTFRGRFALVLSLSVFGVTTMTSAYHIFFLDQANGNTIDTLVQYTIATLGVVITLFYVQSMIEAYLENEITKHHANTDYLTKLPNRRKMDGILHDQLHNHQEKGSCFAVSMFDIDHFKTINDRYGHEIGDNVLKELTSLVVKHKREGEYFGRWGGEEFLLVFSDAGLEAANKRAADICKLINKHKFAGTGTITCSFGIAQYQSGEELKDLLKRADDALYSAKANGRNRVECA